MPPAELAAALERVVARCLALPKPSAGKVQKFLLREQAKRV